MEDIDQQPAPANPQPPPSPDAVLADQLAQCHKAIGECFVGSNNDQISVMAQLEHLNVAERLIRVSIALTKAIEKSGKEFTHRIIVERPMIDVTPAGPPPPRGSRKQPRKENRMK
ncbi:MAG: hypothetical protein ABSD21_01910 [Rhizomicrobium sp.]|jgi:hypothetical protein